MIYGLWLSATGVTTNSHQVDVIANNLANAETNGFRRQLATFQERSAEAKERHTPTAPGDRLFDNIGGGQTAVAVDVRHHRGALEETNRNFDLAVQGDGYFMVQDPKGQERLTRNGNFLVDAARATLCSAPTPRRACSIRKNSRSSSTQRRSPATFEISDDGSMRGARKRSEKSGCSTSPMKNCCGPSAARCSRRLLSRGDEVRWPDGIRLPRKVERRPGRRADQIDGSPTHARRECESDSNTGFVAGTTRERRRQDLVRNGREEAKERRRAKKENSNRAAAEWTSHATRLFLRESSPLRFFRDHLFSTAQRARTRPIREVHGDCRTQFPAATGLRALSTKIDVIANSRRPRK